MPRTYTQSRKIALDPGDDPWAMLLSIERLLTARFADEPGRVTTHDVDVHDASGKATESTVEEAFAVARESRHMPDSIQTYFFTKDAKNLFIRLRTASAVCRELHSEKPYILLSVESGVEDEAIGLVEVMRETAEHARKTSHAPPIAGAPQLADPAPTSARSVVAPLASTQARVASTNPRAKSERVSAVVNHPYVSAIVTGLIVGFIILVVTLLVT